MDWPQMLATIEQVKYKDWRFVLAMDGPRPVLQIDLGNGWKSRKWLLSSFMTESELVQTCLKAVLTAEEHEARERFTYEGAHVFGPHINIRLLVGISDTSDVRDDPPPAGEPMPKRGDADERF